MDQPIDQFSNDIRLKLANIESGMDGLKAKIDGKAEGAEQQVRKHLDSVQWRIEQGRAKVTAAEADMQSWLDEKKSTASDQVADWKAKRETAKLQNRADKAERYVAAALEVALAALDDAEQAALEAWLARQDAKLSRAKRQTADSAF